MKKLIVFLIGLIIITGVSANIVGSNSDVKFTTGTYMGKLMITGIAEDNTADVTNLVIPSMYEGVPVEYVGDTRGGFKNMTGVETLTFADAEAGQTHKLTILPASFTNVASDLREVYFPNNILDIQDNAFGSCTTIQGIFFSQTLNHSEGVRIAANALRSTGYGYPRVATIPEYTNALGSSSFSDSTYTAKFITIYLNADTDISFLPGVYSTSIWQPMSGNVPVIVAKDEALYNEWKTFDMEGAIAADGNELKQPTNIDVFRNALTYEISVDFIGIDGFSVHSTETKLYNRELSYIHNSSYYNAWEKIGDLPSLPQGAMYWSLTKEDPQPITKDTIITQDKIYAIGAPTHSVTYSDGVEGEEIFASQVYNNLLTGEDTPSFITEDADKDLNGNHKREGYVFTSWSPEVSETVGASIEYIAQWARDENNNDIPDDEETINPTPPSDLFAIVTYKDSAQGAVFKDQVYDNLSLGDETPNFNVPEKNQDVHGNYAREGYVFLGWSPRMSDTVTGSVTYQAKWAVDDNNDDIPDNGEEIEVKPNEDLVQTGDYSNLWMYITISILSLSMIGVIIFKQEKMMK